MGISDCLLFSSSKNPMDSNISSSKPTSEFQQRDQEKEQQIRGEEKKEEILVSALRIKTPSTTLEELITVEDKGDTCATPTCMDRRIPLVLSCPPAPRKPEPAKRKAEDSRRVRLDFSKEVEALFPLTVIADFGGKIKKARKYD